MTLVVAIGCSDGVIIAADSASTDSEIGTKQLCEKITRVGNRPVLCGASGDFGLIQKINESLGELSLGTTLKRIRQDIKRCVAQELEASNRLHVPYPQQGFQAPPSATYLFVGVQDKIPWILEIEKDSRDTMYDASMGRFAAIGSGKPWAQAFFRPHLMSDRDLRAGMALAYRVVEDAIELAAGFLARLIHIYTISLDGTVRDLDSITLNELADTCQLWREIERESLGRVLSPASTSDQAPQIPMP
jgi:20S proteasome alpha/beta subunit